MFGIDRMHYYVPKTYLDMETLATARNVDVEKYRRGLGQEKMAVLEPHEDIITMAAEAANPIIDDKEVIDLVLFATESGVDYSKASSVYLHKLLGLSPKTRVIELKQACYALTSALHMAVNHVKAHPLKKVLIVSSDVAWYGFNTPGEVTQGAGAIAMMISKDPKIAIVHDGVAFTDDVPDFYRPNIMEVPIVDGKFSIGSYNNALKNTLPENKLDVICFHMPFAKMADKANQTLGDKKVSEDVITYVKSFSKEIGNIYNGSLYLALLGVLTNAPLSPNQRIGMFSYGSGSIGEFFEVELTASFEKALQKESWNQLLKDRTSISIETYESNMESFVNRERSLNYECQTLPSHGLFYLEKINNGHRIYQKR